MQTHGIRDYTAQRQERSILMENPLDQLNNLIVDRTVLLIHAILKIARVLGDHTPTPNKMVFGC